MNWLKMTAIIATAAATTISVEAQNNNAVRYVVRFPAPQTHYVSVEALLPTAGQAEIEVFMPVWTPGSYLIREYARNIEAISVSDPAGKPLAFAKSRKNRWRIETGGAAEIRFSYRVYCREMSVRTNWVEDSFALLNGAPDLRDPGRRAEAAPRRPARIAAAMEDHNDRAARSSGP